jgi:hypothetical protein
MIADRHAIAAGVVGNRPENLGKRAVTISTLTSRSGTPAADWSSSVIIRLRSDGARTYLSSHLLSRRRMTFPCAATNSFANVVSNNDEGCAWQPSSLVGIAPKIRCRRNHRRRQTLLRQVQPRCRQFPLVWLPEPGCHQTCRRSHCRGERRPRRPSPSARLRRGLLSRWSQVRILPGSPNFNDP